MIKMGTDIHCYIEKKREDGSGWDQLGLWTKNPETGSFEEADFYNGRCYPLFGLLAGVRSGAMPIASLRGIPEDMSDSVCLKYGDGSYFHDPTWYDYHEIATYLRGYKAAMPMMGWLEDFVKGNSDSPEEGECVLRDVEEEKEQFAALVGFMDLVDELLFKYNIYFPKPGQIRITMWFDS